MKSVKLILLFLLFSGVVASQNWVDSISNITEDTSKLNYLKVKAEQTVYSSPQQALEIAEIHDSIASRVNSRKFNAQTENIWGMAEYVNGQYDTAIERYVSALSYYEDSSDEETLARVYNNLATCYQITSDNETSTRYFEKALELYQDLEDTIWIANINSNLGLQYLNDELIYKASEHVETAISLYKTISNEIYLGIALLTRGNLKVAQEKHREAISDYEAVLEKVPEQVSPLAHAAANGGMGTAYNRLGDRINAKTFLTRSLEQSKKIGSLEQQREVVFELAKMHFSLGEYKRAYKYQSEYIVLKDSSFTQEQDAKLVEVMTKYETVQKEREIEQLNAASEIKNVQLVAKKRQVVLLGIGSVILLGLIFGIYQLYKKVSEQKEVIERALSEKDTLLREIHHRVKNNLQVISSLLALQSRYVKDDSALDALHQGQDRVQSMALIHQDLYQHNNLKGVNTRDYLEELIENLLESYKIDEGSIDVELDIDPIMLDVDTMIPLGLIVNELISNSLKHAFINKEGGRIEVMVKDENEKLFLRIRDNGVGVEDFEKVEDSSFGFSLIKSFAQKLQADMDVNTKGGFSIEMNVKNVIRA